MTNNPYYNRTEAIAEELARHDIKVDEVSRHHLFGTNYILIKSNDFIYHAEERISEILNIPQSWIAMALCCEPHVLYIKEDEFIGKYPHIDDGKPLFPYTINLFTYRDSHFVPITIEEANKIWKDGVTFEEEYK